jgi:hypothetical protein
MAADGVTKREIARRLGIKRQTVRRLVEASEPSRYERALAGSMLNPLEPVIRGLLKEWPRISSLKMPPRSSRPRRGSSGRVEDRSEIAHKGVSVGVPSSWRSESPQPRAS